MDLCNETSADSTVHWLSLCDCSQHQSLWVYLCGEVFRIRMADNSAVGSHFYHVKEFTVLPRKKNNQPNVSEKKYFSSTLKFRTGNKLFTSWIKRRRVGEERRENRIKRSTKSSWSRDDFSPSALWQNNSGVTINLTMMHSVIAFSLWFIKHCMFGTKQWNTE